MVDAGAPKRILVVAPASAERRSLLSELLDWGFDLTMAEDAGRAMRELKAPFDGLVLRPKERRLAARALFQAARTESPDISVFAWAESVAEAEELAAILEVPCSWLDQNDPDAAVSVVGRGFGMKEDQPESEEPVLSTLDIKAQLWQSPRGAMHAWHAQEPSDGRALFWMGTTVDWPDDWRRALVRTLSRAGRITHDHLGRVLNAWTTETRVSATYVLPEGQSLATAISQRTFGVARSLRLVEALASVLEALHAAPRVPILFGPVDPGQVWLGQDEIPTFFLQGASFLAYQYDRVLAGNKPEPALLSPEELRGEAPAPPADVFYAMCFLYRLLTGTLPFPQSDASAFFSAIRDGGFRDIRMYMPAIDDQVADLLTAGLSPHPEARPSVADLRERLT